MKVQVAVDSQRLELAILRTIAKTPNGEWWQCGYGDFYNRLREIDPEAANESETIIIDALVSLADHKQILLEKFNGGLRSPFDLDKQNLESYRRQFFGYGQFNLRLIHEGRSRIPEPVPPRLDDDFPTSLQETYREIDYWAREQRHPQPGSIAHGKVSDRLTQLRSLEQRFVREQASRRLPKVQDAKTFQGGFGNYTVGEIRGEGGTGVVFEARADDGESCAVKVLRSAQSIVVKRFRNEIGFCFPSKHRNIVRVIDFGQTPDNRLFYVMPLYSSTLRKLMGAASVPPQRVLDLFSQVLEGIEAAHLHEVCHRDLKPENILYAEDTDTLLIADFGIARFKEEDLLTTVETSPQERLANFLYAAPEQRKKGALVDHRSDIYALGLILNEMFTSQVLQGTGFIQIASIAPRYGYLDEAVHAMVQQDPAKRPSSIQEVRTLLRLNRTSSPRSRGPSEIPEVSNSLSTKERDRIFDEGDIELEIMQGMAQTFIISLSNKSEAKVTVRKLRLSCKRVKVLEWAFHQQPDKPWEIEAMSSRQFSWNPSADPVAALMQMEKQWKNPFEALLDVFIQVDLFGRIKTFNDRSVQVRVEPGARRIWHVQ